MIKRKISLALVLTMLLTLMMPSFAFGSVKDYDGHWAEDTIDEWFDNDLIEGYPDGTFVPDNQVTRAEFMTMVNSAFEFTEKAEIDFSDVNTNAWYYQEVQKAVQADYIIGDGDKTARPEAYITRQEAALIITRIKNIDDDASSTEIFKDFETIASWSVGGVGAATEAELMIGYEDDTFRPTRNITRAESLVTVDRSLAYVEVEVEVEVPGTGGGSGGGSGGGNPPATPPTSPTAITFNGVALTIVGDTATTTTASAITTSAAITITTYVEGENVSYVTSGTGITTGTAIVTTSSAINTTYTINVPLATTGATTIIITVGDDVYTIIVPKEEIL